MASRLELDRGSDTVAAIMSSGENAVGELFDRWAKTERAHQMSRGHEHIVRHLFEGVTPAEKASLLDVGCGPGYALDAAQKAGFETIAGIDLSAQMIELAKHRVPRADLRVGAASSLPWGDREFTMLISIESIYYHSEPERTLSEALRVTSPGARVCVALDFFEENQATHHWPDELGFELRLKSEREWVELMTEVGFVDCRASRIYAAMIEADDFRASKWIRTWEERVAFAQCGTLALVARTPPETRRG